MHPLSSFLLFLISFYKTLSIPIQVNNITDSLSTELTDIVTENEIVPMGFEIPSTTNMTKRDIDQSIPSSFFLSNKNVELGIDKENLLSVIADEEPLPYNDYDINYIYRENVFSFNQTKPKNKTSSPIIAMKCNYTFYDTSYQLENQTNPNHYDKIIQYQRFIFGLKGGVLYNVISYNGSDFSTTIFRKNSISLSNGTYIEGNKHYGSDKILPMESIINIFLSHEDNTSNTYIIAVVSGKIYIFDLLYLQYQIGLLYQAVLMENASGAFLSISSVNDAHINGGYLYIASSGIDVYSFDNSGLTFLYNIDKKTTKDIITSFAINTETIYAIAKNKGLIIYEKEYKDDSEDNVLKQYPHSHMSKLYPYVNSFNAKKYIGVFFEHSSSGSEFYMELFLYVETDPYINRIFTASEEGTEISQVLELDLFFLYFYDRGHNKIYSIRKAILNKVSLLSYIYVLDDIFQGGSIYPYYNQSSTLIQLSVIKGNDLTTFTELRFPEPILNCTFYRKATYALLLARNTDTCASIADIDNKYDISDSICFVQYLFKLRVLGEYEHDKPKIVVGILMSILVIVAIVLFCVFYNYYKVLSENRFQLIKIDKNDRMKLYIEAEEEEHLTAEKDCVTENEVKIESKRKSIVEEKNGGYQLAPADSIRSQKEQYNDVKVVTNNNDVYVYQGKDQFGIELE